jgi:transcriptional regulator of NAD metabolism
MYSNNPHTLNELKHSVCVYGSITNAVDIIKTENKGKHLNTLERFHTYKVSNDRLLMNNTFYT